MTKKLVLLVMMFLGCTLSLMAQNISGKVVDEKNILSLELMYFYCLRQIPHILQAQVQTTTVLLLLQTETMQVL